MKTLPECAATDWTFEGQPPVGDARALDFFFLAVKHQYGFWTDDGRRYLAPMYGDIGGRRKKGSDFVWAALRRSLDRDPSLYNMERQAGMADAEIETVFAADDGRCPLPMVGTHCEIWRAFAKDLIRLDRTPEKIVTACRADDHPVASLMRVLSGLGGYREDPLAKKAALLAMILSNRPERFLISEGFPPIVDYHIQRSALRIGLVRITDARLEESLRSREMVSEAEEGEIRRAVYAAMEELVTASGKGMDALDWFFFQNRRRCPEMSDPECGSCEIQTVCAQRKELFQPVRRTTFY